MAKAQASTKVTLSADIKIGTDITIPISTPLPPTNPGEFSFQYPAPGAPPVKPANAPKIAVGKFLTWAESLGSSVTKSNLPTSLQTLNIAVTKLDLDTKGTVEVDVTIGKMTTGANPKWDSTWTPISGLSLSLSDVSLSVNRTTG